MIHDKIIRILLVDDVELVRQTLRTILSAHPRFAIVVKPATEKQLSRGSNDAIPRWW